MDYGLDGLSTFLASHQPCGPGKLLSLDGSGRAFLGTQGVASADSGGVERFQGAWAV